LRFVNSKSVRQYIDEDNIPKLWGGNDDYEFMFEPEIRTNDKSVKVSNNNEDEQENLNLSHKKVS
jgi:hypothetical protein